MMVRRAPSCIGFERLALANVVVGVDACPFAETCRAQPTQLELARNFLHIAIEYYLFITSSKQLYT
jgi:hypothetical protein